MLEAGYIYIRHAILVNPVTDYLHFMRGTYGLPHPSVKSERRRGPDVDRHKFFASCLPESFSGGCHFTFPAAQMETELVCPIVPAGLLGNQCARSALQAFGC